MQQRADAKSQKNDGLATFCKLILNSAFGGDILNSEKYKIADNLHAVQVDSEYCRCNNCLQVGYFTLDSANIRLNEDAHSIIGYRQLDISDKW
ncbi:MAG: hypothetical protein EZS28_050863 [Streblomastix strix]|uniref:Uncharacterized protein n=1 Tax=Streblomastix strix TaxID=222440 RepID=A0A5J4T817_9EUKA|nr:MAG: hypothetical protein EZS28_050863 [Streblomastix strix]